MTVILKLNNGTEVVGDVEVTTDDSVVLGKPLQINYKYVFGSTPSVSFVRYIMFAESDSIMFKDSMIVNRVTARKAFADYYHDVVNDYYDRLEKVIDAEFEACLVSNTKEQYMMDILEMMPVDGAIN
jgi:hypothetical protein